MFRTTRAALAGAAVAASAVLLVGCAATVSLQAAPDAKNAACASVIVAAPDTVARLQARTTDAQGTAAWGAPASVLLRCGVDVPGPTTTPCIPVNGVDWLRDDSEASKDVYTFTTYGRDPAVQVVVHDERANGLETLEDLADAVKESPTDGHRCLSEQDVAPSAAPTP